ncbi:hypothetical protein E4U43_008393 [Claviceps pusilla]|uniref:Cytochrome P450 3A7 n=1 Tax=Claviceps pusilla TaxID=123648 RepID=A0A9P7NII1_9HYPO|nr:hypothetical protein E4U43_008393 [Claviceps pusilla]
MLARLLLLVLGTACAYAVYRVISGLRRNIAVAKRSNLPYLVVPCNQLAQHWLLLCHVYARIIKLFPKSWWDDWLDLMLPDSCYQLDFQRFTRHGDVLLFVSPFSITVQVSNAEAIRQITTQREKFPKPWQMYTMLAIFGDNIITTEGPVWKAHRRATSATFNEKNSALVFREIIVQTNGLIDTWLGRRGVRNNDSDNDNDNSEPLATISADITRLTINVIGYVGFGLRLLWPGQSLPPDFDAAAAKYTSLDVPDGYTLSFVDTLMEVLDNILLLLLVPRWLLRILPLKKARIAAAAYEDYVRYLDEMLNDKIEAVRRGVHAKEGMDIMGALAQGSFGGSSGDVSGGGGGGGRRRRQQQKQQQQQQEEEEEEEEEEEKDEDTEDIIKAPVLTRDEILGNAFIMFVAGHETAANTLHFTLINLATNPAAQRLLQGDIDELVGDTECSTWDYESLMGPMTTSALGACMSETLRIQPPGPVIPKQVSPHSDQVLNIEGRECILPRGSLVTVYALMAHEDPRHWPYENSELRPGHDDLRDYRPERWFETEAGPRHPSHGGDGPRAGKQESSSFEGIDEGIDDGNDDGNDDGIDGGMDGGFYRSGRGNNDSKPFFRPRRGAYLPFSEGPRSCLGRRVAQVEVMTFLLVLFQRYSVELAADEWASEAEVRAMDRRARTDVYRMAQAASRRTLGQARTVITLGLQGRTVPMRLVPRGREKFVNWMT